MEFSLFQLTLMIALDVHRIFAKLQSDAKVVFARSSIFEEIVNLIRYLLKMIISKTYLDLMTNDSM
jgi:hypothetical protein